MSRVLVGADVGGSKTVVAVAGRDGRVHRFSGPGAAVRPGRALVSAATIASQVRSALAAAGFTEADVLAVGAAGTGRALEREELLQALRSERLAARVVVTTDIELALVAAFGKGPGIVVSAGTGSIALARDAAGTLHRTGGYGWQMGDEGSGYALGRAALAAVGRAADGLGPVTDLSQRLLAASRVSSLDALIGWAASAAPVEIASVAPAVLDAAAANDAVALDIVRRAAGELAGLVRALLPRIGDGPVEVALAGGLLQPGSEFRRFVTDALTTEKGLRVREAAVDAVAGALRLAEELEAGARS